MRPERGGSTEQSGSLRIEPRPEGGDRWDAYVRSHPKSTPFHLSAWLRIVGGNFGYPSHSCLASRGETACGVLPLFLVPTLPWGHALVSIPMAVYGGICADDEDAGGALLAHAKGLARRFGVRYLELRHELPVSNLPVKTRYVTFRKSIEPDPERNMAATPRNQRRSIRVGMKAGLTAEIGGEERLDDFYDLYSLSVRNLGSPVYPKRFFRDILLGFGSDCRVLTVIHQGRAVSGVLSLFHRNQVLPYYAGSRREALPLACNDFMYWSLLCYGADRGYTEFDFGRSKIDSGAYHFKRHWGFEPTPLAYQYYLVRQRELPDLSPSNPKFDPAIRIWRRLPLRLTQWVGPALVRYFP